MKTTTFQKLLAQLASAIPGIFASARRPRAPAARSRLQLEALEDRCNPSTLITSVPYVIAEPGSYALAGDLYYSARAGAAITVRTSDVVINLNGHKLWSAAGPATLATGIAATDQANISIQNGTIRGFQFGVELLGEAGYGNQVTDLTLANNTYIGLWVDGAATVVANNRVQNTGGCDLPGYTIPIAIHVAGPDSVVVHNRVTNFVWSPGVTLEVVGLALDDAPDTLVAHNVFTQGLYTQSSWGLWVNSTDNNESSTVDLENNFFANFQFGSAFDYAQAQIKDNRYANVPVPWYGTLAAAMVDLGGNTVVTATHLQPDLQDALTTVFSPPVVPTDAGGQRDNSSARALADLFPIDQAFHGRTARPNVSTAFNDSVSSPAAGTERELPVEAGAPAVPLAPADAAENTGVDFPAAEDALQLFEPLLEQGQVPADAGPSAPLWNKLAEPQERHESDGDSSLYDGGWLTTEDTEYAEIP